MFKKNKSTNLGFSLLEILFVIAIIGILTTIAIGAGNVGRSTARDTQRKTDMRLLQVKLEAYKGDHGGVYPTVLDQLIPNYFSTISNMPLDPLSHSEYKYFPLQFNVPNASCGVSYYLTTQLENNNVSTVVLSGLVGGLTPCSGTIGTPDANTYSLVSPDSFSQ